MSFKRFEPDPDATPPDDVLAVTETGKEITGPPDPLKGFAFVGDAGMGKTTALVRYAVSEARRTDVSVFVVDRSGDLPSWFTYSGEGLYDLTSEPARVGAALRAGVTVAVSSANRQTRSEGIQSALQALADHPSLIGRLSLIIDDGDDMIDEIADLVEARRDHPSLALTIAWRIKIPTLTCTCWSSWHTSWSSGSLTNERLRCSPTTSTRQLSPSGVHEDDP